MSLQEDWLRWLRVSKGRSPNTVATYARSMRTLGKPPEDATEEDVEAWWETRGVDSEGKPRPHSSRNNELAALRSFYKWAQRFNHLSENPTTRVDPLRAQRRVSRFIGSQDLADLLSTLSPDLRRAVALGAYGGLRVSETAVLSWRDVNENYTRMIVRGKGDKERTVGIPVRLLDIILPDTGGNIVTGRPEPYTGHYLQMKVNAAIKAAGVDATYHKLRHRFGYLAAEAGVPVTSIAHAMGHESLTTTMGYIAATDTDLDLIAQAVTR